MTSPSKKSRLLIVTTTFPRWKDDPGPAPFVLHLARAMLGHFQVTVLAPHHQGAAKEEDMDGVVVKRFSYAWPDSLEVLGDGAGIQNNMRKSPGHRLLAGMLIFSELFAIRRELSLGNYDYINSHWLVPSGLLTTVAASKSRHRHVITAHAADYDLLMRLPGGKRIIRFMAPRALAMVCVSRRLSEGIKSIGGARGNIITQPMGVDLSLFQEKTDARSKWSERIGAGDGPVILFAGKLTRKKGVDVLIRAVAQICCADVCCAGEGTRAPITRDPNTNAHDCRLIIVGDGEQKADLVRLASELNVSERVIFLGAMPNRELAELYGAADVVAVPSVLDPQGETEGMPVVILEALAAGRPVVATRLCSVPEDLVGRGVIEVVDGDPSALASAILAAIKGKVQVDNRAVSGYDMKKVAQKYAAIFLGDNE